MTKQEFDKLKPNDSAYLCWKKSGFTSYVEAVDRTAKTIQLGLTGCGKENRWFSYKKVSTGFPPKAETLVGVCPAQDYEFHIVERLETFKK